MIEIRNLTKKFGDFTAVDGLDLTIETGEFFGLLGPNGAGKTTTISMLSTVLLPSSGEIRIDGLKLDRKAAAAKRKLSVITQEYSMRQDMTMNEVMEYQGRLYYMKKKEIREKSDALLEFAGLADYRHRVVRHLSGGMKRKLMVCRALMTDPEIILLDEPTAGMDAISRRQMWNLLRQLHSRGITILLTTHYIDEAQSLCDRVALIDRGRLDIIETPEALIRALGPYTVETSSEEELVCRYFQTREEAIRCLEELDAGTGDTGTSDDAHTVGTSDAAGTSDDAHTVGTSDAAGTSDDAHTAGISDAAGTADTEASAGSDFEAANIQKGSMTGATLRNTTLEDVFVERIGRRISQK